MPVSDIDYYRSRGPRRDALVQFLGPVAKGNAICDINRIDPRPSRNPEVPECQRLGFRLTHRLLLSSSHLVSFAVPLAHQLPSSTRTQRQPIASSLRAVDSTLRLDSSSPLLQHRPHRPLPTQEYMHASPPPHATRQTPASPTSALTMGAFAQCSLPIWRVDDLTFCFQQEFVLPHSSSRPCVADAPCTLLTEMPTATLESSSRSSSSPSRSPALPGPPSPAPSPTDVPGATGATDPWPASTAPTQTTPAYLRIPRPPIPMTMTSNILKSTAAGWPWPRR